MIQARWTWVAVGVLAGGASLAACSRQSSRAASDTSSAVAPMAGDTALATAAALRIPDAQRARIHIETVAASSFEPLVEATGTVEFNGDRSTQVLSPISGPALRVLVSPGAEVRTGEPLAIVTSPDFATAVADYRKAENAWRNAKRIADRDELLFKNDALARGDLEQAQADVASAAADRDAAVLQMQALGVDQSQIDAIRDNKPVDQLQAIIRAPITGTVVEKLITQGQLLQAGSTACFTIADLGTMWVLANVFPQDLSDVSVGRPADILADGAPGPIPGRVDYVAALVDPGTKATSVRILARNAGRMLRRDMFVRVAIHAGHQHTGILIPTSAVLRDDQNLPFVFLAAPDGTFPRRGITVGSRVGDRYEVTQGLAAGERIVADGALFLQFAESQ